MKKMNRWLPALTVALAMLFASCSNLDTENEQTASVIPAGRQVTVHITADEETAVRTAFPSKVTRDDITTFILTEGETELGRWTKDWVNNVSAYRRMQETPVTLAAGKHTLTLTGFPAAEEASLDSAETYVGTLTDVEVTDGAVLNFKLYFIDVSKTGYGTANVFAMWPMSWDASICKKLEIYKTEDKVTPGERVYVWFGTYSYDSGTMDGYYFLSRMKDVLPAGYYIGVFEYYSDSSYSVLLGRATDLMYVTAGKTTDAKIKLEAANPTYTYTYHFNGGSLNGTAETTVSKEYSPMQDVVLYGDDAVTKENLTFDGWYASEDFSGKAVAGWNKRTVASNIDLYAKWNYTVTFDANGSEGETIEGKVADVVGIEGKTISLTKNAFEREGYLFDGWNTVADGSGTRYEDASDFSSTVNVTLYAQWIKREAGKLVVIFHPNGGDLAEADRVVQVASGATVDKPNCERKGYSLAGWFEAEDLSGDAIDFTEYSPAKDTNLYAKWEPGKYKIIYYDFDSTNDEAPFTGEHETGYPEGHVYGTPTKLDSPTKADFLFTGWHLRDDYGDIEENTVTTLEADGYLADIELFATWVRNTVYVSSTGCDDPFKDEVTRYGDGTAGTPYATMTKALEDIRKTNVKIDYIIKVSGAISGSLVLDTSALPVSNATSLTISGTTGNTKDKLSGGSPILTVSTTVPITLSNIAITDGYSSSQYRGAGIYMSSTGGKLTLADGALVTGNKHTGNSGYKNVAGGVYVGAGTVVMEDGAEISDNTSYYGAGVAVIDSSSYFIMNGGKISGNAGGTFVSNWGGGMYVCGGANVTMNGGEISGNTAVGSGYGGGVYLDRGLFTLNGGKICDNTAPNGGGMCGYYNYGSGYGQTIYFKMTGGEISGNTATSGGGVYLCSHGFEMTGGKITGNTATGSGGAVYMNFYTRFYLKDGEISNNTASRSGAVSMGNYSQFHMSGGKMCGNTAETAGGIYTYGGSPAYLTGGEISGNTATKGGAICVEYSTYVSGDVAIPMEEDGSNDIYVAQGYNITVNGALAASVPKMLVTADSASTLGATIIKAQNSVQIADVIDKFVLSEKSLPFTLGKDGTLDSPKYDIIYKDRNGADFTATNMDELPAQHQYGAITELVNPTRDGYEFIAWYLDKDCSERKITQIASNQTTEAITIYARWQKKTFAVEINYDGDIGVTKTEKDGTIALVADDGYTDYLWLIGNEEAVSVIPGASVSADGKTFTFDTTKLTAGRVYNIIVSALGANGFEYATTVQVKK